ncbi:hypothetical protein [Streptomyces sp. TRM64462]|uniref:hypothetical protein n=1 Tax=Streptomyces sp. TRM64462 TaxID=2741726 RepID=UPI0020C7A73F|nr:hypothetical protein [Streptomyces sp. TRM64462]
MAVLAVVSALGLAVDDRMLAGVPMWSKPFKFAVSFVAYCLALAWMLSMLPRSRPVARRVGWWTGTVLAVAAAGEMLLIVGQAVRGRRSHFNYATPFDTAVYNAMAVFAATLWIATLVIAVLLFRARIADRASAWTLRLSALLALVGAGFGMLMTQPAPGQERGVSDVVGAHTVGAPDGGAGMPLTGWSTTGGDLRIPHFVGMHALQLLPLLLLALVTLAPRFPRLADPRVRLRLMLTASGAYAAVVALVAWQALRGQPLTSPDAPTLGAAATIALLAAVATWASLRTPPPSPPADGAPPADAGGRAAEADDAGADGAKAEADSVEAEADGAGARSRSLEAAL